jgi:hypothetical protein
VNAFAECFANVKTAMSSMFCPMEQHSLKNINNCLNTNIYSDLETFGGQISNPYLNVVIFFNTRFDYKSVAA